MTKKKPAGATPRRYDEAYKQEAVRLWQSSGRSAEHTARELGISVFNLYEWSQRPVRPAVKRRCKPRTSASERSCRG